MGSLDPEKIKGKIVVCVEGFNSGVEKSLAVLQSGGIGMILRSGQYLINNVRPSAYVLPTVSLPYYEGWILQYYLNSTT